VVTVFQGERAGYVSCTSSSKLKDGAVCYPGNAGESGNGQTLDELPHGSTVTLPAGK
jgi:hypothetical protein